MSTASTILGRENVDDASSFCGSEYGDCFPSEPSESMLKWISSNVINEDDQTESQSSASIPPNPAFESQPPGKPTAAHNSESDSDSDLETELTMGLFKRGRATFHKRDYDATERLLKNCLNRINAIPATTWQRKAKGGVSKDEVTGLLCESYLRLERWDEAESLLMEKLSARQESKKGEAALNDLSTLVTVLFQKSDYIACHLYARQALKGYKRLGPQGHEGFERTLILLVEICKADGKADEEEAYAVMLSDYQERMAEASSPLLPVEPSTPNTDKTEMNPRANNVPRTSPSTPESISASLVPEGSLRRKPIGKKWNGGGKDSPSELSSQIRQSDTVVDDVDDASLIEVPAETLKDSNDAKADASDSQLGLDGAIHKGCVDQNVQAVPPEHDTSIKLLNSDSMKRENIQDSNQVCDARNKWNEYC
ncbi:hypothetical protein BU16DRAFT_192631 [Lophium mytilinum]|uniref:Uncharacterized protein n=1 Tax=Lophium mytilinum TaxID=390894 RepID=A0A6A6RCM8_9PEZI|nr:hypothetical protein BU16DRAFT_192631 [Lophium mytilinum]